MKPITIRISPNRLEEIENEAAKRDMSKSEVIRKRLNDLDDAEKLQRELQANLDELQTENERLKREKRQILEQRQENKELQRYVEDELSYREAGLGTRMKWWLFGKGKDRD